MASNVRWLWRLYTQHLATHPVTSKVATGALITCFGDLLAQFFIEGRSHLDRKRLSAVSGYGVVVAYVEGHMWLGCLEKVLGPSMTLRNSLLKTVFDQGLFAPIETSGFMAWTHYLENHQTSLRNKLESDLPQTLAASYLFWGPVCLFEFMFVPYPLRVLYISTTSVVWDTFLSYAAHNPVGIPSLNLLH